MMPTFNIPEGDRFADLMKFRRLGEGGGDVLYECWGSAVRAIQEEAYRAGMAAAVPECTCPAKDMPFGRCCKVRDERATFERWYDAQKDGRIEPWDVWSARAMLSAVKEVK